MGRSPFAEEPITATRAPSPRLLKESRTPASVRPTIRVPEPLVSLVAPDADTTDPDVRITEAEVDSAMEAPATLFAAREIYALRSRDPRSDG